jgi:hypothetical protein
MPQGDARDATDHLLPNSTTGVTPRDRADTQTGRSQETLEIIAFKAAFTSATTTADTIVRGHQSRQPGSSVVKGLKAGTKAGTKAGIAAAKGHGGFLQWWAQIHRQSTNKGSTTQESLVAYHASSAAAISSARGVLVAVKKRWQGDMNAAIADTIKKRVAVGVAAGTAAVAVARCR